MHWNQYKGKKLIRRVGADGYMDISELSDSAPWQKDTMHDGAVGRL